LERKGFFGSEDYQDYQDRVDLGSFRGKGNFGSIIHVQEGFGSGKGLVLGHVTGAGRGELVGIDEESAVQVTGV